jgi:hypothetical protein
MQKLKIIHDINYNYIASIMLIDFLIIIKSEHDFSINLAEEKKMKLSEFLRNIKRKRKNFSFF